MQHSNPNIINQGIGFSFSAYGSGLEVGKTYTACLYANANNHANRAEKDSVCALTTSVVNGVEVERPTCVFEFTAEQTLNLKAGNAILEIYDKADKTIMVYDDQYATVRKTSLTPTNSNNNG